MAEVREQEYTEINEDNVDEIIDLFVDDGSVEETWKDNIHIHSWYESGDCCERGRYAEVEDSPSSSAFHDDLIGFAQELLWRTITKDEEYILLKAWDAGYDKLEEYWRESALEDYWDDDGGDY